MVPLTAYFFFSPFFLFALFVEGVLYQINYSTGYWVNIVGFCSILRKKGPGVVSRFFFFCFYTWPCALFFLLSLFFSYTDVWGNHQKREMLPLSFFIFSVV